jgi:hypothetical protein
MVEEANFVALIAALIGALSGSVVANLVTESFRRRSEKELFRKNIVDKYLIQLQYAVQDLLYRLHNIKDKGGPYYMMLLTGDEKYYNISTLYVLGAVLAYHRILLFGGIYSQIELLFPSFGTKLSDQLDKFGNNLDALEILLPDTDKVVYFFRYDRIALGDAVTEETNERYYIRSFLKFKREYEKDNILKSILIPAYNFVQALQYSNQLSQLINDLKNILTELETKTMVKSSFKY